MWTFVKNDMPVMRNENYLVICYFIKEEMERNTGILFPTLPTNAEIQIKVDELIAIWNTEDSTVTE